MKKDFLVFFFFIVFSVVSFAGDLKVISYNIRYDNPDDGINQWKNRAKRMGIVLNRESPDILGIQEALVNQVSDLDKMLPEYSHVGVGRDDGKEKGEYSAIYYKNARLIILNQGSFWLSPTPDVPGSKGWDAAITRICTWAKFEDIKEARTFFVFNTHFDHQGKQARLESARLLLQKISVIAGDNPVILTGDLNSEPNEEAYAVLAQSKGPVLNDSYRPNRRKLEVPDCTFTGFSVKNEFCKRIDYVFSSPAFSVENYTVILDSDSSNYNSDHVPVLSLLKWEHQ